MADDSMNARPALLIFILCAILPLQVHAAEDDSPRWHVWLHDGSGRMVLVNGAGEALRDVVLPIPQDHVLAGEIAAAPDGERMAFIANRAGRCASHLMVYDAVHNEVQSSYDLEHGCINSNPVFNETATKLALVIVEHDSSWHVTVLDTMSGSQVYTLDDSDAAVSGSVIAPPLVHDYRGQQIMLSGFTWQPMTGAVTQSAAFSPSTQTNIFAPTGEVVTVEINQARANTLYVYDPMIKARYPFYAHPRLRLSHPRFVQNGQRILVQGTEGDNTHWLLLERDGSLVRPLRSIERQDIHGTAEGFVYTAMDGDGYTELVDFNTSRPFSDRGIWRGEGEWRIIWVDSGARTYGPFLPWAQLAEPIFDSPVRAAPVVSAPFPTPAPVLYSGLDATVQTFDGEVLYLRAEPGTEHEIVMHLFDGMRVNLLEGPVHVDGYTWWRVRMEDGTEGWAAEIVDNVTTLIPTP